MDICKRCSKQIKFIRHNGKVTIVNKTKTPRYFIPGEGSEVFITDQGDKVRGRSAPDGRRGYKEHVCW